MFDPECPRGLFLYSHSLPHHPLLVELKIGIGFVGDGTRAPAKGACSTMPGRGKTFTEDVGEEKPALEGGRISACRPCVSGSGCEEGIWLFPLLVAVLPRKKILMNVARLT